MTTLASDYLRSKRTKRHNSIVTCFATAPWLKAKQPAPTAARSTRIVLRASGQVRCKQSLFQIKLPDELTAEDFAQALAIDGGLVLHIP